MMYTARPLSPMEENELYGEIKIKVGTCFKKLNHYYLQREKDVLHINTDNVISSLPVGYLNNEEVTVGGEYRLISKEEFTTIALQIGANLGFKGTFE